LGRIGALDRLSLILDREDSVADRIALERQIHQAPRAFIRHQFEMIGLAAGEKVITQGLANVLDGAEIKRVAQSAPQRVKAPPPGAMKAQRQSGG
jgi:hypothetical protein